MESLVGNSHIKQALRRLIDRGPVGNSLLFSGPRGVGKGLYARAFAQELLQGAQVDLHIYTPAGRAALHSMDAMRSLIDAIHLPPTQAPCKVFIIDEAERLPTASANALLKTFEEPPEDSLILLISSAPDELLPTVRSRCLELAFHPVDQASIAELLQRHGKELADAERLSRQARGSVAAAVRLAKQGEDLIVARTLRLLASRPLPDFHALCQGVTEISAALEKIRQDVSSQARATQGQQLDKQAIGAASRAFLDEVDRVLETVGLWYRDAFLLQETGKQELLAFPEHAGELMSTELIPLDRVQGALRRCRIGIERFSRLSHCLEALFLELAN